MSVSAIFLACCGVFIAAGGLYASDRAKRFEAEANREFMRGISERFLFASEQAHRWGIASCWLYGAGLWMVWVAAIMSLPT